MIENISLPENIRHGLYNILTAITADSSVRSIILFGSTVHGILTPDSDVDLLVLVDDSNINIQEFSSKIRKETFGKVSFPFDLIIETQQEFMERSLLPTLERKISREGKVLYAA